VQKIEKIYQKLGQKVREERKSADMTQEELAFKSGLNRAYIGYIERAERNPSIETINKIAATLNIPLYKFFIYKKGG
jgi:transcriptional regulator with XRE-family HTH domain